MNGTGPGNMNSTERKEWVKNLLIFLIPLFYIYSNQITGALQFGGFEQTYKNLFNLLIPTPLTIGAIYLYVVNALTDLSRKFLGDNR